MMYLPADFNNNMKISFLEQQEFQETNIYILTCLIKTDDLQKWMLDKDPKTLDDFRCKMNYKNSKQSD